ncbi:MAG: stage II sporulation protein P, partial [Clostridia bacterium]
IKKIKKRIKSKDYTQHISESINNKILNSICIKLKKSKLILVIYIFGILGFAICLKNIKISPKILNFATNFRQAQPNSIQFEDILNMYAMYNKSSYILKDVQQDIINENVALAVNENIDAYSIIDMQCDKITDIEVFSKTPNIVITEETKSLQRVSLGETKILNYSSRRNIDFNAILKTDVILTKQSDKILLYNTHTSESYSNSDEYKFEYDGIKRSRNANFNMLAIAKELKENLKCRGINAIHDTTPHDYGTYTSAYAKSRKTVKNAINNMGSAGISIDVHRDASSNLEFRPIVNIKGIEVSQLMFVMGIGTNTNKNEYYEQNLKLAIKIQQLADEIYPGLFRPMMIRDSIYNQDLNKYSMLVEVGATGNTIDEAKLATRCLTNLLNIIYKD